MTDQLTMFGDTPVNFPKGVIPSETIYWISIRRSKSSSAEGW